MINHPDRSLSDGALITAADNGSRSPPKQPKAWLAKCLGRWRHARALLAGQDCRDRLLSNDDLQLLSGQATGYQKAQKSRSP